MSSRFTDNALTIWKVEGFRLGRLQLDDFEVLQFEAGKPFEEASVQPVSFPPDVTGDSTLQCLQAVLTSCCTALERATAMLSSSSGMVAPSQRQGMPRASLPAIWDGSSHLCDSAAHSKHSTLIPTSLPAFLLQHTRQAVRFLCSEVKANLGRNCVMVREEEQGAESRRFKEVRLQDSLQDQHSSLAARHALLAGWLSWHKIR